MLLSATAIIWSVVRVQHAERRAIVAEDNWRRLNDQLDAERELTARRFDGVRDVVSDIRQGNDRLRQFIGIKNTRINEIIKFLGEWADSYERTVLELEGRLQQIGTQLPNKAEE